MESGSENVTGLSNLLGITHGHVKTFEENPEVHVWFPFMGKANHSACTCICF